MQNKFRIGIDFHGVINTRPDFFRDFCTEAVRSGIEIYIISGGPRETITDYLNRQLIPYTQLWCIYDYYEQRHQVTYYPDGSFYVEEKLWNQAKADYCRSHHICVHIDDSEIYSRSFVTPYCLYNERKNTCTIDNETFFLDTPQTALNKLLAHCCPPQSTSPRPRL